MLLSGVNNLDFSALCGLSGDMSRGELFALFRNALKPGLAFSVSDQEINQILDGVFSRYEIRRIAIPDDLANQIATDVQGIITGALTTAKAGAYYSEITGVVNGLKSSGLALAPIGYSASTTKAPAAPPPSSGSSSPLDAASFITNQVFAPFTPTPAGVTTGVSAPARPAASVGPATRYIKRPHVQTAAEKSRLIWIIGGFSAMLFLTIVVMAAKSGD